MKRTRVIHQMVGLIRVRRAFAPSVASVAAVLCAACAPTLRPLGPIAGAPAPAASAASTDNPGTSSVPVDAADISYFEANPLMVPVLGVIPSHVPDSFNEARDGGRTHRATDILAPMGTPVLAAEPGTILRVSQNNLGGNSIYMTDDSGRFILYYAHLERYAAGLTAGEHVAQGDVLGYVGMTGNAPVPHLHFQAMRRENRHDYWNSAAVDVRQFFTLAGRMRDEEPGASQSSR